MQRFHVLLAFGMLISGALNTLTTIFANKQEARGTGAPSTFWGKLQGETGTRPTHTFDHPYFQCVCMFLGELLCLAHNITGLWRGRRAHAREAETAALRDPSDTLSSASASTSRGSLPPVRLSRWGSWWFAIPAICDMTGTGTMYAGLCLSSASVYQMLRGATVAFTCAISAVFLRRRIFAFQWFAVFLVITGVSIVGYASTLTKAAADASSAETKDPHVVIIGDVLIVLATFVVAVQMCAEEKILSRHPTPAMKVVGLEGLFGFLMLGSLLTPMYYVRPMGFPFENPPDAVAQMMENPTILLAMLGSIFSIALFNFFGICVTQSLSAAHRMVLDNLRTCLVWGVSLALGWEEFQWLQLVGFTILTVGTCIYNEVFTLPCFAYPELGGGGGGSSSGVASVSAAAAAQSPSKRVDGAHLLQGAAA